MIPIQKIVELKETFPERYYARQLISVDEGVFVFEKLSLYPGAPFSEWNLEFVTSKDRKKQS